MEKPEPFDIYLGDNSILIMCFYTKDVNYDEENIFKFYSKDKYWLKYKNDLYFLLIKNEPQKKVKIRLIKKKEYWLPDDLWSNVKEYAGVYNITTKWGNIMSVGVDRIHKFYKENFNRRVTNAKTNPTKAKKMILKSIINIGMNEDKYKLLAELVDCKRKVTKNTIDFSKYKVGEEVIYTHRYGAGCANYYAGIITKVNEASITFKPYKVSHKVSDNPNAARWQYIETIKHYYDKNNFDKPKNVRTCFQTKNTCSKYKLYMFDYYEETTDWGR